MRRKHVKPIRTHILASLGALDGASASCIAAASKTASSAKTHEYHGSGERKYSKTG